MIKKECVYDVKKADTIAVLSYRFRTSFIRLLLLPRNVAYRALGPSVSCPVQCVQMVHDLDCRVYPDGSGS